MSTPIFAFAGMSREHTERAIDTMLAVCIFNAQAGRRGALDVLAGHTVATVQEAIRAECADLTDLERALTGWLARMRPAEVFAMTHVVTSLTVSMTCAFGDNLPAGFTRLLEAAAGAETDPVTAAVHHAVCRWLARVDDANAAVLGALDEAKRANRAPPGDPV